MKDPRQLWETRQDNPDFDRKLIKDAFFIFPFLWAMIGLLIYTASHMEAVDTLAEFYQTELVFWIINHQLACAIGCFVAVIAGAVWFAKARF